MFRDAGEELHRLEAALLAEEEALEEEGSPDEAADDLEDVVYHNFSNGYGSVTGYKAYNTDKSDEDLQAYSETVRKAGRGISGLTVILIILTGLILAVLVFLLLRYRGVL